jgi:hypothetical protein
MNPALELLRNQWVKAQIRAPSFAQDTLIPHLNEVKEVIRLLIKPYLPIYQLQGQGECGPLTVVYAGLDFAKPFLEDLLFVEATEEKRVGQIPFWQSGRLADEFSADIVIVEAAKQLIHRLPRHNAFVTPEFVHFTLDVRGDWEDVEHRFHKTVHRNDLRRIRKFGISCAHQANQWPRGNRHKPI